MDATGACGGTCRRRWGLWLGLGVVGLGIAGFVVCAALGIGWRQTTVEADRAGTGVIVRITRTMIPGLLTGHPSGAYELAEAVDQAGIAYKSDAMQVHSDDYVVFSRHVVEYMLPGVPGEATALWVRATVAGPDGAIAITRDALPIRTSR